MTYLRMYCNSLPIVLSINHSFANFEETFTHFNQIWIIFIYHIYIIVIYYYFREKVKKERRVAMGGKGDSLPNYS